MIDRKADLGEPASFGGQLSRVKQSSKFQPSLCSTHGAPVIGGAMYKALLLAPVIQS